MENMERMLKILSNSNAYATTDGDLNKQGQKDCVYRVECAWYNLPYEAVHASTLNQFKSHIDTLLWYRRGSPMINEGFIPLYIGPLTTYSYNECKMFLVE